MGSFNLETGYQLISSHFSVWVSFLHLIQYSSSDTEKCLGIPAGSVAAAPKASDSLRPIVDLSLLTHFLQFLSFE